MVWCDVVVCGVFGDVCGEVCGVCVCDELNDVM